VEEVLGDRARAVGILDASVLDARAGVEAQDH
jgi:hypothetical protein